MRTPIKARAAILHAIAQGTISGEAAADAEMLCHGFDRAVDFVHRVADGQCTNPAREARDILSNLD